MTTRSTSSTARALARLLAAGALLAPFAAHAQARWAVDTSASAGVETNPYQSQGSSGAALTGTLDVRPSLVLAAPLTNIQISGDAQGTFYANNYSPRYTLSVLGSGTHRLSEHTTLSASVNYLNYIAGSVYGLGIPTVATLLPSTPAVTGDTGVVLPVTDIPVVTLPTAGLPTYINDPSLGNIGQRQQSYQASGTLATAISPRDQISLGVATSINRFSDEGRIANVNPNEFNYFAPSLFWQRALAERFSIGAGVQVGFIDYLGTDVGDSRTYSPQLTLTRGFGRGWTLAGSAGVTIADQHELNMRTRSTTSFSGSANLCQQDVRRNICLTLSRQVTPSSFDGLRAALIASASVGYRLDARSQVQFSGSYSHADEPLADNLTGFGSNAVDYATATGSYSRLIRPALSVFVSAGYAQSFSNRFNQGANVSAQAGVSYRFGPHQ